MMRIGLVSDASAATNRDLAAPDGVIALAHFVRLLSQQGFRVQWLTAIDTAQALAHDAGLAPVDAAAMPPTCQYVLPYELYHLDGAELVCLPRSYWQDRALHTRLFTFICLMQRERPCALWQTWGTLATTYLTAYTAAFLNLPCAVFYTSVCLCEAAQQDFIWQWVTHHTQAGLVGTASDRADLLAMADLAPEAVQVLDPLGPAAGERLATLYQMLQWRA
jgi:hypothetical protein